MTGAASNPATGAVAPGRRRLRPPRLLHGILGFVVRRIAFGVLVLFVVSLLVFAATQLLPGDPARAILGTSATPQRIANLEAEIGLDKPVVQQYLDWVGGLLTGDLGNSTSARQPVADVLSDRIVNSLFLMLIAAAVAIPLSLLIGVYSALKRDGAFDNATSGTLLVIAAIPEFVLGVVLILVFATTLFEIFPGTALWPPGDKPWQHLDAIVLPVATLVIPILPYVGRVMRAAMIEVLESDYVEMARLKGLSERRVVWRHAVPNALPATFQVIALSLAVLAGGIVIVEFVFAYEGVGTALSNAVQNRDLPVIQAIAMLIAFVYVVMNALADIGTILVTPRLRTTLP